MSNASPEARRDKSSPLERPRLPRAERGISSEQREREARDREALLAAISAEGVSPATALELVARHGESSSEPNREEVQGVSEGYGIPFHRLSELEQRQLAIVYFGAKEGKTDQSKEETALTLDRALKEQLTRHAFRNLDELRDAVQRAESPEVLRSRLRELMGSMGVMVKRLAPDEPENEELWLRIFDRYKSIVSLKGEASKEFGAAFNDVFIEHQEFIENEFVARESQRLERAGRPRSAEHLMQEIFGRTKEEIESVKVRNRVKVAEFMQEHKDKPLTVELLEELHRINNDGIVPKKSSRLRRTGEQISFGVRVGIIGGDVREEMEELVKRMNEARARRLPKGLYELTVAKLHNDMLDIHPFPDRNGSTSLLLAEFMAQQTGYRPDKVRNPNFYEHLRQVMGYNTLAMAAIAEYMRKIVEEPGYYAKGKTVKGSEKHYEKYLGIIAARRKKKIEESLARDAA